ncbi:PAS domain-containing protein [Halovenus salina]|uniref:histidine kinase n=1 Tax=Halovenus salina TaxID=1510225 RepID=A0ABD5W391_9EURY|nr:PAS domain-containing protein [Halovenus salina]
MQDDSGPDTTEDFQAIGGEAESVYEIIVREMEDAVFFVEVEQTDDDYTFTFRRNNASHQQLTGLSEDELRGQTPQELLGDEQGAAVAANYRRCVEQGETIEYEEKLEFPAGTSHWQTKLTPITDDERVTQIVGVARDVTEQKEQQQKLQRLDRQFETVLETMSAAVFLKDTDGQYLLMNQACRELLNVDDQDIVGLTDDDLFPSEVAEEATKDDRQVIESGEMIKLEEEIPTATGNTVRLTRKSPVYDDDGEITGICGVSTDITGQKQREREVTRLKERFELAVEGANLGVWDWDMRTDEVEFNEQWARMLGHSLDEIEPHLEEWEQRVHPDDLDAVEEALDEHIAGETELYDTEHRMRTADGNWKWIRDIGKIAERDEDGEPARAVGIHLDIDDRKTYQRQLAEEREMFTQGPAVVFKWREAEGWPIEHVSENVEAVLGYTADELQSGAVQFAEIIHEEDRERVMQEVADNNTEGTEQFSHEPYRIVTADGTVRWMLDYTRNVWQDGEIINRLGYLVDITEQRQNEIYLQNAQKVADIGWWRKEIPSDEIYWSEHVYDMWEADGEIGYLDHERFLEFIHPEDTDRVDQAWQAALDGEPYDVEHRIITGEGNIKWMQEVAEFTRDETGDPIEAVGIVQDITEIKEYEQTLENQRDNLEVLNQIVRHDIRNDLQVMLTYGEVLEDYVEEAGEEYLQNIMESGREAVEITQTAAEVTEVMLGSETDLTPVNLRSVLEAQMTHVRTNHERALVSAEGEVPDTTVLADDMLESVFRNVLNNAIVHNDKELPEVTVSATADEETVRVRIADNGPGIPDEQKGQVFREGEKGLDSEGTGLGLYLVQTLVDRYGGTVQIENNEPDGSVFIVELRREQ